LRTSPPALRAARATVAAAGRGEAATATGRPTRPTQAAPPRMSLPTLPRHRASHRSATPAPRPHPRATRARAATAQVGDRPPVAARAPRVAPARDRGAPVDVAGEVGVAVVAVASPRSSARGPGRAT